jgi:hypothetical protein
VARAAVDVKGGGWSLGLTSAGYLTVKFHFYAKDERTPVCYSDHRRSARNPVSTNQTQPEQRCSMCTKWLAKHGDGKPQRNNQ